MRGLINPLSLSLSLSLSTYDHQLLVPEWTQVKSSYVKEKARVQNANLREGAGGVKE